MKKSTPGQLLEPYKAKIYQCGGPFIVFNPAPRCYVPMIVMGIGGSTHYTMHPDVPTFSTLEAAQDYHTHQLEQARADKAAAARPQLYVPPGRGKLQG